MRTFLVAILSLIFIYVNGQNDSLEPVKWSFYVEKSSDDQYKLVYNAEIEDGWAIYSQHIADGGPIPTSFIIEEKKGLEIEGEVIEPQEVETSFDDIFEMELIKIKGSPEFYQLARKKEGPAIAKGFLTYMACDASKCLPPTDVEFKFEVE